jgi:hypothetical protein
MDALTTLEVIGLKNTNPSVFTPSEKCPNRCFTPASPGLITAQLAIKHIDSKKAICFIGKKFCFQSYPPITDYFHLIHL